VRGHRRIVMRDQEIDMIDPGVKVNGSIEVPGPRAGLDRHETR